jgi:hypothetical protein
MYEDNAKDPLLVDLLEEFEGKEKKKKKRKKERKNPEVVTYKCGWFLIPKPNTNTSKYQSIYQGYIPTQ